MIAHESLSSVETNPVPSEQLEQILSTQAEELQSVGFIDKLSNIDLVNQSINGNGHSEKIKLDSHDLSEPIQGPVTSGVTDYAKGPGRLVVSHRAFSDAMDTTNYYLLGVGDKDGTIIGTTTTNHKNNKTYIQPSKGFTADDVKLVEGMSREIDKVKRVSGSHDRETGAEQSSTTNKKRQDFASEATAARNVIELKSDYDRAVRRAQDEQKFSFDKRSELVRGQIDTESIKAGLLDKYLQTGSKRSRAVPKSVKNRITNLMGMSYEELNQLAVREAAKAGSSTKRQETVSANDGSESNTPATILERLQADITHPAKILTLKEQIDKTVSKHDAEQLGFDKRGEARIRAFQDSNSIKSELIDNYLDSAITTANLTEVPDTLRDSVNKHVNLSNDELKAMLKDIGTEQKSNLETTDQPMLRRIRHLGQFTTKVAGVVGSKSKEKISSARITRAMQMHIGKLATAGVNTKNHVVATQKKLRKHFSRTV